MKIGQEEVDKGSTGRNDADEGHLQLMCVVYGLNYLDSRISFSFSSYRFQQRVREQN